MLCMCTHTHTYTEPETDERERDREREKGTEGWERWGVFLYHTHRVTEPGAKLAGRQTLGILLSLRPQK